MHELEVLLSRLKMEHLSCHVESLLEQAAKKELNYPSSCVWRCSRSGTAGISAVGIPAETGSSAVGQNAGAVRLQLPAWWSSGSLLVWRSWNAAKP